MGALAIVVASACSDTSGCGTQPLPGGALPADQTVEGGAQIRVTRQGFAKLTSVVPGLINAQIANGFCVPQGSQYSVDYCYQTQGQCSPGCKVTVGLNQTVFSATNSQTLTVAIDMSVNATVPTDAPFFDPCNIYVDGDSVRGIADIELGTDVATGELTVRLARIRNVDLSDLSLTGSGGFCSGASTFADFLKDYFAQEIVDYLTPRIDQLVRGFLPDPLGIEGVVDVGPLLASISPGSQGAIEARLIPGGFVTLDSNAQGLSLGVITGINSDEDPATRSAALDSEPALCVPPIAAPSFGSPPHSLPITARSTFSIPAVAALDGMPDPVGSDLAIGLSETTLDLIGHHAVASGVLCLGIGTRVVPQLELATFGLLVPSIADLGTEDGHDPVLLVTRPQQALDFTIGENTAASPALTVHARNLEIDVYAFLYERYVRAFTIEATVDLGINLEFDHPTGGPWRVKPTLVGLNSSEVTVRVLNSQFVAESAAQLEAALPAVLELLVGQLAIPPISLPTFAGFDIVDPSIAHIAAPQDDFLALNATLDVGGMPFGAARIVPTDARATLRDVVTPAPADVRAALAGTRGALPTVTIDVDRVDARGRELEWSWRIGNGLWHPFTAARPLVIAERAFAWQGHYTIGLVARVAGSPETEGAELRVPVVIDSVGPHVVTTKVAWDDDGYAVPGWDIVDGSEIRIAFGTPGDTEPQTPWQTGGTAVLERAAVARLAADGELAVFLEDGTGNQTIASVLPFHGEPGTAGCACGASRGGGPLDAMLVLLAAGFVVGRRRRDPRQGGAA
jgi:MYXO-CTERM domain-containing protein